MKLHLSGPMTGIPDYNRPEFNRVAEILRDMGHEVFNPATDISPDTPYRAAIAANLVWICTYAEGMVSLGGYSGSKGARAEAGVAHACGIPRWRHMPSNEFWPEDRHGAKLERIPNFF